MKSKFFRLIFALTLFAGAADAADAPTFLKTGKTYRLIVADTNNTDVRSHVQSHGAKILENGGGGWFFVEYSAVEDVDGKKKLVPHRTWLNFAHVVAASEEGSENQEPKKATPKKKP